MYHYINRYCSKNRLALEQPLTSEFYNIGSTWEDYLNYAYVPLSDEQVEFMEKYPNASVYEIWQMKLPHSTTRTLKDAKKEMIEKINYWDSSNNVNDFTINNEIHTWFDVTERLNYKQSIEAAKLLGVNKLSFFVGNVSLDVKPEIAEGLLAQLQLYADACYIVTKQHKINVDNLATIEEVDGYDYTSGYPDKLNFDLI